MNSDSTDTSSVVRRVLDRGRAELQDVIFRAFLPQDEAEATKAADTLYHYALAMFDGAFLATQADPSLSHHALMDQMADSLAHLGQAIVHGQAS